MNNYMESKKKFDEIRNKVGEVIFRMSISHLMDVGIRHLTAENVEETCNKIMQEDDTKHFMTNEFKCDLVKAAYELAQLPHTDLLVYIQRKMSYDICDGMPSYERAIKLLQGCLNWLDDDLIERAETVDNLEYIGFNYDEIEALGFGYLFDDKEEN